MTEKSLFWYTDGFTGDIGDGAAPYTQEEFRLFNHSAIAHFQANVGVFPNTANGLSVSGIASPLALNTGRAIVYGFPYWNDASLNLAVTTPSVGDTGGRVVLRATYSTQQVRAAVILSNDGTAALPALTQSDGAIWEIPLYSFVIDTSGDIYTDSGKTTPGVTDEREFVGPWVDTTTIEIAVDPGYIRVPDGGIGTTQLAADSVTGDIVGDRVPQIHRRQGGSASNWITAGSTTYTPGDVRMQVGSRTWSGGAAASGSLSITFPVAFSEAPIVLVTLVEIPVASTLEIIVGITNVTTTGFDIRWLDVGANTHVAVQFTWQAIGSE